MASPFQAPLLAQARGQYPGYTLQAYRQNPSAYPGTQAQVQQGAENLAMRRAQFQADPQGTMMQRQAGRQAYRADPMAYPDTYALLNPIAQQMYNQGMTRQMYLQNPSLYPDTMAGLGQLGAQAPGPGNLWGFMANPQSNPQLQAMILQAMMNRQSRWNPMTGGGGGGGGGDQ
mgnify:FL=1